MSDNIEAHSGPTASQQAHFQMTVNSLAHHMVGIFIATNTPPTMATLVASQIIRAVMLDLIKTNPELSKLLLEDLATGLVELCAELGVNSSFDNSGATQQ